jgi:hypothetical protein
MKKLHDDPRTKESTYEDHARSLQAKAKKAHVEWLATMKPSDRARLRELHLESPPDDSTEVGGHSPFSLTDIADSSVAKCETNIGAFDQPENKIADQFGITLSQAKAILTWHHLEVESASRREKANYLQIIVGGLLASKNPKLNSAGLAFAANLAALNGLPCQREFARRNHISPSAISKVVRSWQKSLDIAPSAHQKSEEACKVYSQVGKKRHWRAQKINAGIATALLQKLRKPASSTNN